MLCPLDVGIVGNVVCAIARIRLFKEPAQWC